MPSSRSPSIVRNGALCCSSAPLLSVGDGFVQGGRGAFETLAAYRGRLFLAAEHFARLRQASSRLDLSCPADGELTAAARTVLEANDLDAAEIARVRITLSSPRGGGSSWWVEATPPPHHPPTARVITGPFVRNERGLLAGLKTTNCGENFVALKRACEAGADEALFGNGRDELCEGTWSNVFVRIGGRWITPPLSSGCLPGITRRLVLELLSESGHSALEETLLMRELERIESAFLTSSLREIQPIAAIDGRPLQPDPLVARLHAAYRERTRGWTTG